MKTKDSLILNCKNWGYFYNGGIHSRNDLFRGKDILDVGMGQGPHSVFYLENGAKSYTGVDPDMDLNGNGTVRNHKHNSLREKFPFSPNDIMNIYPNCRLYDCLLENLSDEHLNKYDLVIMTMVTEHLQNNPTVISQCYRFLKKGGIIWSSHANYYFWDGHHELPRYPQFNSINKFSTKFTNWKHLYPDSPVYYQSNLNRIKLKDLQKIFEKYFVLECDLDLVKSLIPYIPEQLKIDFPELSDEDLISHHPIFIGKKRETILDINIDNIKYYHPITNIEKNIINLFIENDLCDTHYPNNKWDIIYQKHLFKMLKYESSELLCKTIEKTDININQFKSCGLHFRLYGFNLVDNMKYKLQFEIKSLHNNTNNKKVKIYTGIKWVTTNIKLSSEYQIVEVICPFKFSGSSKYRIGIENLNFNDSFSIQKILFEKQ